ncbi:hypothetical protein KL946_000058 [Ogataea haglerorum]|uniref:COP9 signalosome complex subunit 2 n=1 Tax=Ogataea haglerorum TaxID=1937702 RepID=A0ABQ7RMF2_9ASCO|nr:hypothetical protein KL946_000058 [Ogataea haglerorum]
MSDWDDDMYDDDEEELSFEEDDVQESVDEAGTDMESRYFWGKELRQDEKLEQALQVFQENIDRNDNSEYVFKSTKQALKVSIELGDPAMIMHYLDLFLKQLPQMGASYGDASFSKMLHRFDHPIAGCSSELQKQVFDKFSAYLRSSNSRNERLIIRVELGRAGVLLAEQNYNEARSLLQRLEEAVTGSSEAIKSAYLLEVIALEMVIASRGEIDVEELSRLTKMAENLGSSIPQSRIVGIIKECSGLVAMFDEDFQRANHCFQESFRGFNECGDDRRVDVLMKYIISNLLSESEIDPFQSGDFQGFDHVSEIVKLMELYRHVQETDIAKYNALLNDDEEFKNMMQGNLLAQFIPFVTELVHVRFVLGYLKLFKRVSFRKLQEKLKIHESELEVMLLKLYGEGKISNYKLDMVAKTVELCTGSVLDPHISCTDVLERLQLFQKDKLNLPSDDLGADSQERLQELLSTRFLTDPAPNSPTIHTELASSTVISREALEPLITTPRSFESSEELFKELGNYLEYIKSAIPSKAPVKCSIIERVRLDNQNQEREKISQIEEGSNRDHDHLIPEVVQFTMMENLDMSSREQPAQELSEEELKDRKLTSLHELVHELSCYYDRVKRNFSDGLYAHRNFGGDVSE